MHVNLPRLTLQPIIENAILHGILEKPSRAGTLVITGWEDPDEMVILISDDGVGMEKETLRSILSGNTKNSGGSNIAIVNTHKRLLMLYGEDAGLVFHSTPGEGTEVEIHIPDNAGAE